MKAGSTVLLAGVVVCAFIREAPAAKIGKYEENVLYSFCSQENCTDGETPYSSLLEVKGTLYGTTRFGGTGSCRGLGIGCGTVFSLDPNTGVEKVLYAFCSQQDCADGAAPFAGLIDVNGTLYGTTTQGGAYGPGTVFALDPNTGAETVVHSFGRGSDGHSPSAGLIAVKGVLYSTTFFGGGASCGSGCGTVFSINPITGAESVVYSFLGGTDGWYPNAGLIDVNGKLYGTTTQGGAYGPGTVFALDPNTGTETVVHSFGRIEPDGTFPGAGLIYVKGMLYGTTTQGGSYGCYRLGCGTMFSLNPITGAEMAAYSFCSQQNCTDGSNPQANLIDINGMLYGTTENGGADYFGTVFALDPSTGTETVVHSFSSGTDGMQPVAGLIDLKGKLYGTTTGGGAYGDGTVFVLEKRR